MKRMSTLEYLKNKTASGLFRQTKHLSRRHQHNAIKRVTSGFEENHPAQDPK
jgi:hypothetical protein